MIGLTAFVSLFFIPRARYMTGNVQINYISDFFLFIAATLVGNWQWQLWLDKREAKIQKAKTLKGFLAKIQSCILELNTTPLPE